MEIVDNKVWSKNGITVRIQKKVTGTVNITECANGYIVRLYVMEIVGNIVWSEKGKTLRI